MFDSDGVLLLSLLSLLRISIYLSVSLLSSMRHTLTNAHSVPPLLYLPRPQSTLLSNCTWDANQKRKKQPLLVALQMLHALAKWVLVKD
ncbi:hypothetical protein BJ741DRAFT_256215 [Chytriomyces cf. hyalinus JEL632]|nr:hypothetical protein BJ741DRAFT_256215 [Chytriomyces cf. hyalinus JEL632]